MTNKHLLAYRNQLANSRNPFQGEAKRVLTVCSAGLLRSPTTALVLHDEFGYNCRAAGIVEEFCLIPVTEALIFWSDEIVFAKDVHLDEFNHIWAENLTAAQRIKDGKFQVLNVPDTHGWNEAELRVAILANYDPDKN